MSAVELLKEVASSVRPVQNAIAESIERFLDDDSPMMCVNAETGIGKTLAYGAPVALAAGTGRRVLVSTHTTQQLAQVLATMHRIADALPKPVSVALRLGRANFISPGRVARILANRDDLDEAQHALLDKARTHAGLIDEFETDHGVLPVPRSDFCLTSSCTHQSVYDAQRVATEKADVVVQTHAMSVLDAVRGEVYADIVVYDEGDALPAAAAGFAESRVTSLDLAEVSERHALMGLSDAVAAFEEWAESAIGNDGVVFKQSDREAERHAQAVRAALRGPKTEHVRDLRRSLAAFISLDSGVPYRGAAVVATRDGYAFEVLALEPGRVLRRTYENRKTLFISATLALGSNDFEPFLRAVGAPRSAEASPLRAEIENFGSMAFVLADRDVPTPFNGDGERDPTFFDYAANVVRAAMDEGGRTLVLTPSFAAVDEMARRIEGTNAHRSGEALGVHLEAFKSSPNGVLVTPAAWAGTDLPGLLDHVVILRVPFLPPHVGREVLLHRLLEIRGYDGANVKGILHGRSRRETIRRLAQGFGRGIRTPSDRVKIWIADPRFPLPDTLTLDPRRLLGQGHALRHGDLSRAIPRRFGDAYARARIFSYRADKPATQ